MPTPSHLTAEISLPEIVHLPANRRKATVTVDVLCRLNNSSDDDYVVGSESLDDAHHWHVLSESHREVMRIPTARRTRRARRSQSSDVHPFVSQLVAGGHSHSASHTLVLDARKLTAGKRYTVRYAFHGYVAEADFTVLAARAARGGATKSATRRPTKRKASAPKRKAALKAPARKPAPRKK